MHLIRQNMADARPMGGLKKRARPSPHFSCIDALATSLYATGCSPRCADTGRRTRRSSDLLATKSSRSEPHV